VQGKWKVEGNDGAAANLSLRSNGPGRKQIDWKPLGRLVASEGEQPFNFYCLLHPDAVDGEIVLLFEGEGSVNLQDMSFARANTLFGRPTSSQSASLE
jgi:hypothetical protein